MVFRSLLGCYFALKEGTPLLGLEYTADSFQVARRRDDIELMARVVHDLSPCYILTGQFSKLLETSQYLIALIEKTGKEHESFGTQFNIYSWLNGLYGWSMGWRGNFAEGRPFLEKGLAFSAEIQHRRNSGVIALFFWVFQ